MLVPNLVKNGIYSYFALPDSFWFPFGSYASKSDLNLRNGLKTIFSVLGTAVRAKT
jgi:hypothetical protein